MCGIVGYLGKQKALPILLDGLKRLEYRGYDSAGVSILGADKVWTLKKVGRVAALEKAINGQANLPLGIGIAHTRWATHGVPSEANAHPHSDCHGKVWLCHNGIIENYQQLKKHLIAKGHRFVSQTDTEVLAHLVEENLKGKKNLEEALAKSLLSVEGTFAVAVVSSADPDKIVAARRSSPLLLGIGQQEYFLASDASAVLPYTKEVIYLNDDEIVSVSSGGYKISNLKLNSVRRKPQSLDWSAGEAERGGYKHFMLKEIFEGPLAIENALRGRVLADKGLAKLGGFEVANGRIKKVKKLIIVSCGTSLHSAFVGEYLLEHLAKMPVEVIHASEFRYRDIPFEKGTAVLAISQSGETADTLAAIRKAKENGLLTLGVVNTVGSSIARETIAGVYNHAGPEIGVASTKAFVSQLSVLTLIALWFGRMRGLSKSDGKEIAKSLNEIPKLAQKILEEAPQILKLARKYRKFENFLYLGRKYNYPTAMEGALKIKEIAYVHAEGYAAGEMKHGPIALISPEFPTVAIATSDDVYPKMISNIQEIKARKGPVIAIATEGDREIKKLSDDVIYIPKTLEILTPILAVIPLQLLAYYMAVLRGCDVDKPRNLAKSVTVE